MEWGHVRDKRVENHYTVAELISHKNIDITYNYVKLSPDSLQNTTKILGEGLALPRG